MKKVKVLKEEFELENRDSAFILAIQDLTNAIREGQDGR